MLIHRHRPWQTKESATIALQGASDQVIAVRCSVVPQSVRTKDYGVAITLSTEVYHVSDAPHHPYKATVEILRLPDIER